jgi:hypothetical protein
MEKRSSLSNSVALGACCLLAWGYLGCTPNHEPTKSGSQYFREATAIYSTGSVAAAERALLDFASSLDNWEATGRKGIDYAYLRTITYGRLYRIHKYHGDGESADKAASRAVTEHATWKRARGEQVSVTNTVSLDQFISAMDSGLELQWLRRPKVDNSR